MTKVKPGRHSADSWRSFRIMWEADPLKTFEDIAKLSGCSRQAVGQRAKKEDWKKRVSPAAMAVAAQERADQIAKSPEPPAEPLKDPYEGENPGDSALASAVIEDGVEQRAKILQRHRSEWNGARKHVYTAINNGDFDKAKLAKITAEALKIVQDGERKAWGLDAEAEPQEIGIVRG